jgi:magnesium-transporting ATPase (P-type)
MLNSTAPSDGASTSVRSPEAWLRTGAEVAAELGTDIERGLTSAEAAVRLERGGPNELDAAAVVPTWKKLLAQFEDPLI